MEKYGVDKPDLRYALEVQDLTKLVGIDAASFVARRIDRRWSRARLRR